MLPVVPSQGPGGPKGGGEGADTGTQGRSSKTDDCPGRPYEAAKSNLASTLLRREQSVGRRTQTSALVPRPALILLIFGNGCKTASVAVK